MAQFRYAVNSNSLQGWRPADVASLVKRCGYEGVEWGFAPDGDPKAQARDMARAAKDEGLEVAAFINAGPVWKEDVVRRYSEAAALGGGRFLRVAHPWLAYNFDESLHQRDAFMTLFKKTREALERLAPLSKEYGIRYVLEMHGGSLTASASACRHLMDGLDPTTCGAIFDVANGINEGFLRPRHSAEVLGPYLAYVHAKNLTLEDDPPLEEGGLRRRQYHGQVVPLDAGLIDWVEAFFALKCVDFSGWVSVEEFWREDPEPMLVEGLRYLKACAEAAPEGPRPPFTTFND